MKNNYAKISLLGVFLLAGLSGCNKNSSSISSSEGPVSALPTSAEPISVAPTSEEPTSTSPSSQDTSIPTSEEKITGYEPIVSFDADIVLSYPGNGQTGVTILKSPVINYIKAMRAKAPKNDYYVNFEPTKDVSIDDYCSTEINYEESKTLTLFWSKKDNLNISKYKVYLSLNEDLSNAQIFETPYTYVDVNNLYAGTDYYWQVTSLDGNYESIISKFTTEDATRMISASPVVNIRDIGGNKTIDNKRVKQGIIYRGGEANAYTYVDSKSGSTHYANLEESALKVMHDDLGIRIELDLRGLEESDNRTTSDLGEDVAYYRSSIGAYEDGVKSSSQIALYKKIFADVIPLADEEHPLYFHCWGGADRTGTIGFLLKGLLGVSFTDLIIDYELTSFALIYRNRVDGNYQNVKCRFTSLANYIQTTYAYEGNETLSQCIENFMVDRLGLTKAQVQTIKDNLLA